MAGGTTIDPVVVRRTAQATVDIASEIHSLVNGTHTELEGTILSGQWKGAGGTAAINAWAVLRQKLTNLETALSSIGSSVGVVNAKYVANDGDMGHVVSQVSSETSQIRDALLPHGA